MSAHASARSDAIGVGDAHLGAGVKFEIRARSGARACRMPTILHDERVGAGFGDRGDALRSFCQLVLEDEGVEGEIALHAAAVQGPHDFGQFSSVEADFGAGGEVLQAEVDGVGAGFDGGAQLRPVSGRAHNFWFLGIRAVGTTSH